MNENLDAIIKVKQKKIKSLLRAEEYKKFLNELRKMFDIKKAKIRKENFDKDIIKILPSKALSTYNEFIIALYLKCIDKTSESTSMETQGKERKNLDGNEELAQPMINKPSYDPIDVMGYFKPFKKSQYTPSELAPFTCGSNGTLPNVAAIRGRILIDAWENNLDYVEDSVMDILVESAKTYMENIVSAVATNKNAFKTRDYKFRYAVGCSADNIYLKNNTKRFDFSPYNRKYVPPYGEAPTHIAEIIAAEEVGSDNSCVRMQSPLSAIDLLDTLKVHRRLLSSNGVYASNVERTIASLHHSTNDEDGQSRITYQQKQMGASFNGGIAF